ncbi:hypothetical protein HOLleu_04394 [Holothuria leucospilota]|uniref:DED domain-containing protein n=1 Tax=Holothuria leucospilota TaxID=206669 RepID=A0A9Q1CTZ3_HOLLE|nr:hypothetical protein HOLleu_04394 [Holothuria leucospilota]
MTSSSPSNQFRLALLRVARQLTHENVQQLAFLCEHISPNRRRELKDAMDLFDQLQEHGVFNKKNVNILIDWLDELQLEEASSPLKTYRRVHLEENIEVSKSCTTHGENFMYFCITCNSKLCEKCYFCSHNCSCEVIELHQLPQEMESRKAKLKEELDSLQKLVLTSENLTQGKHSQNGDSTGKIVMFTNPGKLAGDLLKGLHGKQSKYSMRPVSEENQIAKEGTGFQNMMQPKMERPSQPKISLTDEKKETFQKGREEVEWKQSKEAKGGDNYDYVELYSDSACGLNKDGTIIGNGYKEQCRGNTFGLPSVRCFVGGVMIRENQLVHVFNESQRRGGVLFVCIDPSDTSIEYWRHLVAVDDNQMSPVVMSHKELKYGGINHVLFAVGKMVFILHPQRNGFVYESVQSVASLLIDEVSEGSWITSIAAHRLHSECDEFLISISGSNLLREYQISGRPLRTIDTKGCVPSVRSISYVQNIFAVCGSRNDVSLFRTDSTKQQKSEFVKSLSDSCRLLPVCVIWTGDAGWMVLFVSNRPEELDWRVSCYNEAGKLLQVCIEGTSPRYKGVPVSITRWGNTGFISFRDSSVTPFQY